MRQDLQLSDFMDVKLHTVMLGEGIKGFVYVSRKNVSHIFVNESLSEKCKAETVAHELYHLKHDQVSRGIGIDKQCCEFEQQANDFATLNAHKLLALMTTAI